MLRPARRDRAPLRECNARRLDRVVFIHQLLRAASRTDRRRRVHLRHRHADRLCRIARTLDLGMGGGASRGGSRCCSPATACARAPSSTRRLVPRAGDLEFDLAARGATRNHSKHKTLGLHARPKPLVLLTDPLRPMAGGALVSHRLHRRNTFGTRGGVERLCSRALSRSQDRQFESRCISLPAAVSVLHAGGTLARWR